MTCAHCGCEIPGKPNRNRRYCNPYCTKVAWVIAQGVQRRPKATPWTPQMVERWERIVRDDRARELWAILMRRAEK